MAQRQQTKNFHTFVGGLNTEVSPLVYPDNTAIDLKNMVLGVDGSITRRDGLEVETGSVALATHAGYVNGTDAASQHFWRNAGGGDTHLHVTQMGCVLYFYIDDRDLLVNTTNTIDLTQFIPAGATHTAAQVASEPVDIAWGRGQAICVGKYIEPFYMEYNDVTSTVSVVPIQIRVRDFRGIEDLVDNTIYPTSLSAEHEYNLLNQGWEPVNITAAFGTGSEYPAKNMRYRSGFLRTLTASTSYNDDGVLVFDTTKLNAEQFGNGAAPMGKFIISPFNTTAAASGSAISITTWSFPSGEVAGTTSTLRMTVPTGHGVSASDTIIVTGQSSVMTIDTGFATISTGWSFDGVYVVDAVTATTIDIDVYLSGGWLSWVDQYQTLGAVYGGAGNSGGATTSLRPSTTAFFAGRAWYAGTSFGSLGQTIMFSQIVEKEGQYGMCYQANDPTDSIPDLVESDGGQIFIPEMGRVIKLMPFKQSMLILCDNGVWEIDGGANRYFDALDYAVRRVTGAGCVAKESVIEVQDMVYYASAEGLYRILSEGDFTRVLVAENFGETKIQSKWSEVDDYHKASTKAMYDPLKKRVMFMYDSSASPTAPTYNYTEVLLYDMRLDAWFPYSFPEGSLFTTDTYIKGFVRPNLYTRAGEAAIKYLTWTASGMQWAELTDSTTFEDLADLDADGYIITGYESMGDASKDKQVRYISSFMGRVEDSSFSMRGRWDFADADISGKWSPSVEAYRPPRLWLGAHGTDGYPVVVSKHTLPGQGQALSIRYDTSAGAPCTMYGWTIDFQGIQD